METFPQLIILTCFLSNLPTTYPTILTTAALRTPCLFLWANHPFPLKSFQKQSNTYFVLKHIAPFIYPLARSLCTHFLVFKISF